MDLNIIQMQSTTVMSPRFACVASPTSTLQSELKSPGLQLSMHITQWEPEKGRPMRDARAQQTTKHVCSLRWWNSDICHIQSAYLSKGLEKKEGTAKIQLQQCLLLNQKSNGTKKGRTPRKRRVWDGGGRIISTVTTENANTFLKLELNQIQVQQNLKEHCYTLNKVAKIKLSVT